MRQKRKTAFFVALKTCAELYYVRLNYALAAFKAAMEDARADLKAAFSSTDDDSETEGE